MMRFKKVAIIGVGLIGGSLGLAIKKGKLAKEVVGVTQHRGTVRKAKNLGAIDRGTLEVWKAIEGADLIIIATPVGKISQIIKKMINKVSPGCIITDVGSTKSKLLRRVEKMLPEDIHFVGGHPMAGSEKRGVDVASANLFKGSICFLTKTRLTDLQALKKVKVIWTRVGAKVKVVSPTQHDRIVASISHLPHFLAFNLAATAPTSNLRYAAGGFSDATRIASSDPIMWRDIYLENSEEIKNAIDKFANSLKKMKGLILRQQGPKLLKELKDAKRKRDAYIKQ